MNPIDIKRIVEDELKKAMAFSTNKYGDTPTDALQLTPRKYVNLNGTIANRPNSSVASLGQQYFATDLGYPAYFNGTNWVNSVGSVIGS